MSPSRSPPPHPAYPNYTPLPLQLWCAIVLGDMDTARLAATQLGGEKAGRILPEVLRPRNWAKVSKEERQRVGGVAAAVGGAT